MCHVTIVELIKLKILLDFLLLDIIQYKKYKIIDMRQFSFFSKILGPKMGLNDPFPFLMSNHIPIFFTLSCVTIVLQKQPFMSVAIIELVDPS